MCVYIQGSLEHLRSVKLSVEETRMRSLCKQTDIKFRSKNEEYLAYRKGVTREGGKDRPRFDINSTKLISNDLYIPVRG